MMNVEAPSHRVAHCQDRSLACQGHGEEEEPTKETVKEQPEKKRGNQEMVAPWKPNEEGLSGGPDPPAEGYGVVKGEMG